MRLPLRAFVAPSTLAIPRAVAPARTVAVGWLNSSICPPPDLPPSTFETRRQPRECKVSESTMPSNDSKQYPVEKTDAQWREQLDPMQYEVARHAATERAFSGKYWDHFEPGRYDCVGCGTPLFDAATKFDAGCGWPSYAEPINADVVERVRDASHGMVRVEVRCRKCGSHLGHVFDDGPEPSGERFCINSAAIDFAPPK
jgi:peptide-methionine (R)-S-oxide reductase